MPQLDFYIFFDLMFISYFVVFIMYISLIIFILPFLLTSILFNNWLFYFVNLLIIKYKINKLSTIISLKKNVDALMMKNFFNI